MLIPLAIDSSSLSDEYKRTRHVEDGFNRVAVGPEIRPTEILLQDGIPSQNSAEQILQKTTKNLAEQDRILQVRILQGRILQNEFCKIKFCKTNSVENEPKTRISFGILFKNLRSKTHCRI